MRAWVSGVALLVAGCNLIKPGTEELYQPDPKVFFSVGDPQPGVPVGTFQDGLDGWSYLIDISDPADPRYECQHTDEEMRVKAEMHRFPTPGDLTCKVPTQAEQAAVDPAAPPVEPQEPQPSPFPTTHTGLPGMNPLPLEQSGWRGASTGGWGVGADFPWSSAPCFWRGVFCVGLGDWASDWRSLPDSAPLLYLFTPLHFLRAPCASAFK